jgi:hypothetical protein
MPNLGEQQRLRRVVKLLQDSLSPFGITPLINQQVQQAPENGWCMEAATWTQGRPFISVWYDHWLGRNEGFHFWFGFEGSRAQIRTLYNDITAHSVVSPIIYTDSGFRNAGRHSVVDIVSGHNGFVYEKYSGSTNYLGVYDVGLTHRSDRELVAEAVKFVLRVINTLQDSDDEDERPNNGTVEERRKYRIHRRIERNPSAARRAKEVHGTICQACNFDFAKAYGEIGTGFIEAHHLRRIADLREGETVSYDVAEDFAVLCSNCHHMIHKMINPADLEGLRQIVSAHRRV